MKNNTKKLSSIFDQIDYYQSYLISAIALIKKYDVKEPPCITNQETLPMYILTAHFLIGHGIELALKLIIDMLGGKVPTDNTSHQLYSVLIKIIDSLSQNLFDKKTLLLIKKLDKTMEFRYSRNKKWNESHNNFSCFQSFTTPEIEKLIQDWDTARLDINEKLHDIAKTKFE